MTQHYDVIIIGAGASGLMCAALAGQLGRRVLVLEKSKQAGRKILMSGGGRCNFTNMEVRPDHYLSGNSHFAKSALKRYTNWDFIGKVLEYEIPYHERKHGQLFCDDSAKDILNLLLAECQNAGVELKTRSEVSKIKAVTENNKRFRIEVNGKPLLCESLVIATGGLSIPSMGSSPFGYDVAEQFGLSVLPRRAGLVPFTFSDYMKGICETLSGNAIDATVSCNGQSFTEAVLFTHRGLSGPAILQISNYWQEGDTISLDLLPSIDLNETLLTAKQAQGKSLLRTVLSQWLPKALIAECKTIWWQQSSEKSLAEFSVKELTSIADQFHNWQLKPSGTEGYRTAEVTLGGVSTDDLSSKTMESKQHPGLFFIGEVVDVTGHLGGFNFQWAWSSAFAAAEFV